MHRGCGSMGSPISPRRRRRCIAEVSDTSPIHRRCIGDASSMQRDPRTPSTRTPFGRPLKQSLALN
eukprot:5208205-Pyramimonas_sp.AAC.1